MILRLNSVSLKMDKVTKRTIVTSILELKCKEKNKVKIDTSNISFYSTIKKEHHQVPKENVSVHKFKWFRNTYVCVKIYDTLEYIHRKK